VHRLDLDEYDHLEFPGVVPRSFVGALTISSIAFPIHFLLSNFGFKRIASLYVVRIVLGSISALAYCQMKHSISSKFGKNVGIAFAIISCTQFHLFFYMSRTLPNTFALILVTLAYSYWFRDGITEMIFLMTFTIIVFRSEVAVLFAPMLLELLINRRLSFIKMILLGILFTAISLAITISVDSILWKRLLWPEGAVFWYNTYMNKSQEWGVSPFHWYFTNAIPRAMMASLLLVPFGLYYEKRIRNVVIPILTFVFLYSFLPHKELRFIFYVFPILNFAAAIGLVRLHNLQSKSWIFKLIYIGAIFGLIASFLGSSFILYISSHNYPGGYAMVKLHQIESNSSDPYVHIDTYCAMSGVSRYLEEYRPWRYSKEENEIDFFQVLLFID